MRTGTYDDLLMIENNCHNICIFSHGNHEGIHAQEYHWASRGASVLDSREMLADVHDGHAASRVDGYEYIDYVRCHATGAV